MSSKLVLIDGNAILHRAFHALPPMTNSKGQPTNAVYGFISMLLSVMTILKPTHLIVAFDRPAPTFRKKLFKAYQAQRPEMENILSTQVDMVHQVLIAMKIPIFEQDGYEADDLIGTVAKQSIEQKIDEVVVVTGDRDLLQLVTSKVKLFMPVKGLSDSKLFGEKEAEERMGVPPSQIADLKGLMGDPSDNYPGVAGIGPKTAITLLQKFGSVENIYKELDDVENPGVLAKLTAGKEDALMSFKLATVVTDVPIEFNVDAAKIPPLVTQAVLDVFGEMEFRTLLKRLIKVTGSEKDQHLIEEIDEKPKPKKVAQVKDDQLGLF